MKRPTLFISHITEEGELANRLKRLLKKHFVGAFDIFDSSDTESIAAGEEWLSSIRNALHSTSVELILASEASIRRPWVNFEAGAAWIQGTAVIPACHSGLSVARLPMPFANLQAISATSEDGWHRAYSQIAKKFETDIPEIDYSSIVQEVQEFEASYRDRLSDITLSDRMREDAALGRIMEMLHDKEFRWRSVDWLAVKSGLTFEETLQILRNNPDIEFSRGTVEPVVGKRLARLKSLERVDK